MRVCMWVCLYLCSHRADCINPLLIPPYYDGWMPHAKMKLSTTRSSLSINVFCALKCPHFCAVINGNGVQYRPYGWKLPVWSTFQCVYTVHRRTPFCVWQKGEIQACRNTLTHCWIYIIWSFWKVFYGFLVLEADHSAPANMLTHSRWITAISPN